MNLFILHENPIRAAEMHCDKHVIKMILETAQMLSTAHHVYDSSIKHLVYKNAYPNHPCTKWVCKNNRNYEWAYVLFARLCEIYTANTGKTHKSWETIGPLLAVVPNKMPTGGRTKFALAMPDKYKRKHDPVASYRAYYCYEKARFAKFNYNEQPKWFSNEYVLPIKRRGGYKRKGRLAKILN